MAPRRFRITARNQEQPCRFVVMDEDACERFYNGYDGSLSEPMTYGNQNSLAEQAVEKHGWTPVSDPRYYLLGQLSDRATGLPVGPDEEYEEE